MDSSAKNFSTSDGEGSSASSQLEPIDDLIDLLLDKDKDDSQLEQSSNHALFDFLPDDSIDSVSEPKEGETELKSEDEGKTEATSSDDRYNLSLNDSALDKENLAPQPEVISEATEPENVQAKPVSEEEYPASPQTEKPDTIDSIEQLEAIDPQQASTEDLANTVNNLIPLMVELLQFKLNDSREGVIQTVRPVIDRLIEERATEDSQKMAVAIARILPSAIREGIVLSPEEIARAIAPEIALSIREQIRLDADAISQTLGPEMGKAIKAQIELERDAMVDALYPVIGSTISKYMVEVVQDINQKVESTLSPAGIKRKIQAKIQGVSEAELIFKESVGYHVRAIFLIDKDSGLVIQEVQLPGEQHLDSDMIAGMLTAIRSFANDCISSGSELDAIDYGDWQIPLEVAGYCYLAVVVAGEPTKQFIIKIRQVLSQIVMEHGKAIQNFEGNLADVPPGIGQKLEQLAEPNKDKPQKSSPALLWLLIFVLSAILIPWGIASNRARVARSIEQTVATQLDAAPELSVYRLQSEVKKGKLTVSGRVPSDYLRSQAAAITQEIASENELELENRINTVNVPVNPSLITGEIARLTSLFNQQPQVAIETVYVPQTLTVTGFIGDESVRQTIYGGFARIPGIERVVFDTLQQLPLVEQRIYFDLGSTQLNADNSSKIDAIEDLLNRYPQLHLKLTVHTDGRGSSTINQRLGKERCQNVKTVLVDRGIKPGRLIVNCNTLILPANSESDRASWSNRYVSFEPFIPTKLSQ